MIATQNNETLQSNASRSKAQEAIVSIKYKEKRAEVYKNILESSKFVLKNATISSLPNVVDCARKTQHNNSFLCIKAPRYGVPF